MRETHLRGAIVPDLPPEEGSEYFKAMDDFGLQPIMLYSPTTSAERMRYIASYAGGFIYCVARKGVTGESTDFSRSLDTYLEQCRLTSDLPLAVGFGVKEKGDVEFLKGRAEIAVVGTEAIRIMEGGGVKGVGDFFRSLRDI